jgi:hypothetical protein
LLFRRWSLFFLFFRPARSTAPGHARSATSRSAFYGKQAWPAVSGRVPKTGAREDEPVRYAQGSRGSSGDPSAPPPRIKGKITSNDGAKKTDLKDSAVLPARTGNRGFNSIEGSVPRAGSQGTGTAIDRLGGGPSGGNSGKTGSGYGSRPAVGGMLGTSGTTKVFGRHKPESGPGHGPPPPRPIR